MDRKRKKVNLKGQHGYNPDDPDMRAIFVAAGGKIKSGATSSTHPNTDLYNVVSALLGIPEDENRDGGEGLLMAVLNKDKY